MTRRPHWRPTIRWLFLFLVSIGRGFNYSDLFQADDHYGYPNIRCVCMYHHFRSIGSFYILRKWTASVKFFFLKFSFVFISGQFRCIGLYYENENCCKQSFYWRLPYLVLNIWTCSCFNLVQFHSVQYANHDLWICFSKRS